MDVLEDVLGTQRADMVRDDPRVRQAEKIAEAARLRLLTAVNASDVRESWRLMGLFGRAVLLQAETEDEVRVRVGLLTPDDAALRKWTRREDLAAPAGECQCAGPVVTLLAMAARWLAILAAGREARRAARHDRARRRSWRHSATGQAVQRIGLPPVTSMRAPEM